MDIQYNTQFYVQLNMIIMYLERIKIILQGHCSILNLPILIYTIIKFDFVSSDNKKMWF